MLTKTTIEYFVEVRAAKRRIAELAKQAKALDAKAPPKPATDPARPPAVDRAELEAAERALDAGLDGQIHGAVSAADVEALRQARDAARAKLTKGETDRASLAELEQRRVAAFKRQKQPLMDEIGLLGSAVDDGMVGVYEALRVEKSARLYGLYRQAGEELAGIAAVTNARIAIELRRAPDQRRPVPHVIGAVISGLPSVPETPAFRGATNGFVRIVMDPDPKAQRWAGDIEIDAKAIAAEMAREIEAEIARP